MNLTKEEKETLKFILNKHIVEVEKNESLLNQPPVMLAAEVKYDQFLKNLLKKL